MSVAKTGLTAAALGATAYSRVLGQKVMAAGDTPVESGAVPSAGTPPEVAKAQQQLRAMQWAIPGPHRRTGRHLRPRRGAAAAVAGAGRSGAGLPDRAGKSGRAAAKAGRKAAEHGKAAALTGAAAAMAKADELRAG